MEAAHSKLLAYQVAPLPNKAFTPLLHDQASGRVG